VKSKQAILNCLRDAMANLDNASNLLDLGGHEIPSQTVKRLADDLATLVILLANNDPAG
jgi:hypothetical protein